ncbi:MAG: helix-turn-helix transcriptional regulator [Ruminococcaceae bacterium]|nr:helix-turn-helix transcriptional regulator [Oscillospiraceae bacterium]
MLVFAQRLRKRRKALQFTQLQMAERLMVDRTTYNKYETGKVSPSYETLCCIADILSCSIDWLLGRE